MDEMCSPITTIPGLGYRMGAMILAEVGDFSRFDSPDKLLAYAGMPPSTYQSGQLKNCYPHIEKRGSRHLRYALYNADKYVCRWGPAFAAYLANKRAEGKHYNRCLRRRLKIGNMPSGEEFFRWQINAARRKKARQLGVSAIFKQALGVQQRLHQL